MQDVGLHCQLRNEGVMGGHEAEVNARSHRLIRHVFIFHTQSAKQTDPGWYPGNASTYGSCTGWHEHTCRPVHMLQAGHTRLHKVTSKGRRQKALTSGLTAVFIQNPTISDILSGIVTAEIVSLFSFVCPRYLIFLLTRNSLYVQP